MKKTIWVLLPLISIFFIAGCGQKNKTVNVNKIPSDAPEICQIQSNFPDAFPDETIYPNSIKLYSYNMEALEDYQESFLVGLCVKEDSSKIITWYKNKFEPQGYEYFTMETVHYWKNDKKEIMLDLVSTDLKNGYVKYSLDLRGFVNK